MTRTTMGIRRGVLTAILLLAFGPTVRVAWAIGVDCNDNGIDDNCDIDCGPPGEACDVPGCGMSEDCNGNEVPDDCEEQGWQQGAELLADDGAADDYFGFSVSVSGDVALIGAWQDTDNGTDSGSAYVLRQNGAAWAQEQKLLPDDGAAGDHFGLSVSVSGDAAVIGAFRDDDNGANAGSAYVFRWNGATWEQEQKLLPEDGAAGDGFGYALSVSGDVAVIGASGDDDNGSGSGSAYVFRWNGATWVEEQKLLPDDGAHGDSFGYSVSSSGDVAVIGAFRDGDNGLFSGSAYVYRWNGATWVQEQKFLPDDVSTYDYFGISVAVSGDVAVIGAFGDDNNGWGTGSAYVYRWNGVTWEEELKLLADDGAADDQFGVSVSVSGNAAVIGAPANDDSGMNSGSAYVFRWTGATWVQDHKLLPEDGAAADWFGYSVSVSGTLAVIGAPFHNDNGVNSGSTYVFEPGGPDCNGNGIVDCCDIDCGEPGGSCHVPSCGMSQDCNGDGVPDECEPADWQQSAKLLAFDGSDWDKFGGSVAVWDDVAVIGAGSDDDNGTNSGSAYVFRWNGITWVPEQKLLPTDGATEDTFGFSVSLSGNVAVIGAFLSDANGTNSGSAYAFRWNGKSWVQEQKLLPKDGAAGDWFGRSVSVSGDVAVIGSYRDDDNGTNSGAAYVFRWNGATWVQEQKLLPDDIGDNDFFGISVSVTGGVTLIGAHWEDVHGTNSGAAYVFRWNDTSWVQEQKLLADDGAWQDLFGASVSVSGDLAVIGAGHHDDNGSDSGAAYVFRWNGETWVQEQKLLADDGAAGDEFGSTVSISGNVVVIGTAYDFDGIGWDSDAAYVFRWNGTHWSQEQKLLAVDGTEDDEFGSSVSISGDVAIIGSPNDHVNETFSGSAYVFYLGHRDCNENGVSDVCDISEGTSQDANADEIPDECQPCIDNAECTDGLFCNGSETCDPLNGCDAGTSPCGPLELCNEETNTCDPDCNDNGISDGCDVACGPSGGACDVPDCGLREDCNENDVPDECEMGWQEAAKLLAPDGVADDEFGNSVSVSGEVVVIGATDDNVVATDSGSAHVYRRYGVTWWHEQKLLPDDGAYQDRFGGTVSIFGDVAVIGAASDDDNGDSSGSAYVFRWNGDDWVQEQKLLPDDGASVDHFGNSVSVCGDVAVIGAIDDDDNGSVSGSAYVFRFDGATWLQEQKLLPDDGEALEFFGRSVSVSGDVALIGAFLDDDNGHFAGSAYVFRWHGATWMQEQKLLADDGAEGDQFGVSVSVSGDLAVIGANNHDHNGMDSGSAYVFRWNGATWLQEQELLAADGAEGDRFGRSVSVSGDVAVLGSYRDDDNGTDSGAAYVFRWNGVTWLQKQKLLPSDGAAEDWFGLSVSVSGDVAVIGASEDDDNGADSGSAYVIDFGSPDCNENGIPDECDISDGTSLDANGNGIPDECDPCLEDADCDDGQFCNGTESCDFVGKCQAGTPPCGPNEVCNEETDKCEPDCNGNLVADDCDIECGPQGGSCDVPGCGMSVDCNGNGVPDDCKESSWEQTDKLLPDVGAPLDAFGMSVAVSGDVAVIGAPFDDGVLSNSGSAHVFRWNGLTWVLEQELLPNDGASSDEFGRTVAISGDVAVIGARFDDDNGPNSGSAYVFRWNGTGWVQEHKLLPDDGAANDWFGYSVSVSGDIAVIGTNLDDDNGSDSGSAYVFRWNGATWVQEQKLLPDDGATEDRFGNSVSVSGAVAVIGTPFDDDSGSASGSAYVFRRNRTTWVQEQKLLPDDGATNDQFGGSVSVSGDVAAIGAIFDDGNAPDSGSAYVFRWNGATWVQEHKLVADDGAAFDEFGVSVSVSGDLAAIGAYRDDDNGDGSGSAYTFRWDGATWLQEQKLLPDDGATNDWFGNAVSVSGDVAVIGARYDDDLGQDSGSGYVFDLAEPDCNGNGISDECDIADGTSLDENGNDIPDECEPDPIPGDCDGDGDVDLFDYACFVDCVSGVSGGVAPGCEAFDFDGDADVDLLDWRYLQIAFGGAP